MSRNRFLLLVLLSAALLIPLGYADQKKIEINDLWISDAPPTVTVLAAYGKIKNNSSEQIQLESLTSPDFSNIEIHLSKQIEDMAFMEKQGTLIIPANTELELIPGSYHLMLFNPVKPLNIGDKTTIKFNFTDGVSISAEIEVKKRQNFTQGHHHHH